MPWVQSPALRGHPTLSKARNLVLALVLVLPTIGIGSVAPVLADGQFRFLAPGFTSELYGVDTGFMGGVAFASNGDPLVNDCSGGGGSLRRYDHTTTLPPVHGTSTLHPLSRIPSDAGCGMTNHPNGAIYTNTFGGVVKLDATSGSHLGGPFGPAGRGLGIATDPQTGNLVYVEQGGTIGFVNPGLTTSGTFSAATNGHDPDGIFFDPTGNFLFMSDRAPTGLTIVGHDGSIVQTVGMFSVPDGIAFHSTGDPFVVTNNTDGTMTRFDFPGNDFTKPPTQSVFASSGFRGDLTQVGADGCLYITQSGTRYDDGVTDGLSSLVRICPGFAPPPGLNQCTPTGNLLGNPGFETAIASQGPAPGNWIVQESTHATVSQPKHPVHSGSASLDIDLTQSNDFGYVYQDVSGFQPTNGWTFSAYFYAARDPNQQIEHIFIATVDTAVGVNTVATITLPQIGGPTLTFGGGYVAAAGQITQGQWHLISLSATTNKIQMALDAGDPVSLPYTPPLLTQASVTTVTLGEKLPGVLSHFFFDDVALVNQCSGSVAPGMSFTASDKDWTITAQVTPHDGMQVTDLATPARDLGATISMPYVVVASSRRPSGQIYFLLRDGDEIDAQGRVYGHSKLIAGPNIVKRRDRPGGFELQATYLIVLDGPSVANRSQLTVQERIILVDQINDADPGVVPCEPSRKVPSQFRSRSPLICQRFRPALSYTFLPGAGDQLSFVEAVERLHFHPDGKQIAASVLAHDCNTFEMFSPNGDICFNIPLGRLRAPGPAISLFNNEDPLQNEAAQIAVGKVRIADLGGGPGNFPGFQDNIHLTTNAYVGLPLPPPGCPECMHMHWRWASDITDRDLGKGNPLVDCCATLWPTDDPNNDQSACAFLLSNGGANDGSLMKGKIGPPCSVSPGTPLKDPVVWYSSRSGQTANTLFAWGGFVCPSPDVTKC
jgi:sugar lactone lactonase YvrE